MQSVHVAVGVVLDEDRRILITRRAQDVHQGGLWEFPGGKIEAGEVLQTALARELLEELGISIGRSTALLKVDHDYGDKMVHLDVHVIWDFSGVARGMEGQPLAWVSSQELSRYQFPAANRPIVAAVQALLES